MAAGVDVGVSGFETAVAIVRVVDASRIPALVLAEILPVEPTTAAAGTTNGTVILPAEEAAKVVTTPPL